MYELIVDYTRTRDEGDSAIHQYGVVRYKNVV